MTPAERGRRTCMEKAHDVSFVTPDFARWARTLDIPQQQLVAEWEAVRLSRSSRVAPDVVSDSGGGGK